MSDIKESEGSRLFRYTRFEANIPFRLEALLLLSMTAQALDDKSEDGNKYNNFGTNDSGREGKSKSWIWI